MGSEEVLSVLAGFHARSKHRSGHDRINLRQFPGRISSGKAQKNAARHVVVHHKSTSHGGPGPYKQRRSYQNQPNAATTGNGGRSVNHHSPASKGGGWGGSSIGTGGMGKGDGSVGHAVHVAAVESVEAFLGDFVPEVRTQVPAALLSASTSPEADGKGGVEAQDGGDGAVPKKVSKWAAIGRAGKISARATAVCVEEVSAES